MTGQLLRAATYRRVSTEEQVEGFSLDEQTHDTRELIAKRGWTIDPAHEYVDEGISGTNPNRPGWRAMLAAAQRREFDVLVVKKLDRFARTARHGLTEVQNLLEAGVAVVSVKDPLPDLTTSMGRAMLGVSFVFAELERDTIAERVAGSMRQMARQGRWPGGTAPYGWKIEGKGKKQTGTANDVKLVPDPEEREVIRLCVETVLNGRSTADAANLLNSLGHRGRGTAGRPGALWKHQRVREMLRKRALVGETYWGQETRKSQKRPDGSASRVTRMEGGKPKYGDAVLIKLPDPPLDTETFEAVQRALDATAYGVKSDAKTYPNRGAATICGGTLGGISSPERARQYRCSNRKWRATDYQPCTCVRFNADALDSAIWRAVCEALSDPDRLLGLASDYLNLRADVAPAEAATLGSLDAKISTLERNKTDKVAECLRIGLDANVLASAVEQIDAEIEALRAYRATMEQHREVEQAEESRVSALTRLAEQARTNLPHFDLDQQAEVLRLLRVRVTLLDDTKYPGLRVEGVVPGGGLADLDSLRPISGSGSPPPTSRAIRRPSITRSPTGSPSRSLSRSRQSPNRPDTW
ncbi:recombinase family protein [Nocardioides bizhenqiangii]|uniref:Recombinase family protein n=1 Tax=Nocardioides bizhenqiangii TaxID=3095076 RepID=A0ABZ0ZVH2_9ACTN|nr:recombinase family protein [Nocardioides sp. HM61]WQQ27647.1 recombinase family protein [Nocardioides sp. HM61]